MSVAISSPVTGAAQSGLTSPTYTLTADVAPDANGKQWAVTALGGTQTGVVTHSVSSPFTITFWRPKILRLIGIPNPTTGVLAANQVPNNVYRLLTRKGVIPLAGQAARVATVDTVISVPAGSDTVDPEDLRAALSAHIGALNQVSSGIGDTVVSGVM
jgi:hypothetical protein